MLLASPHKGDESSRLPFIAAGRSQEKLEAAVAELPAGAQVQIKTVEHNEAALTELFQGASIVVNVLAPSANWVSRW